MRIPAYSHTMLPYTYPHTPHTIWGCSYAHTRICWPPHLCIVFNCLGDAPMRIPAYPDYAPMRIPALLLCAYQHTLMRIPAYLYAHISILRITAFDADETVGKQGWGTADVSATRANCGNLTIWQKLSVVFLGVYGEITIRSMTKDFVVRKHLGKRVASSFVVWPTQLSQQKQSAEAVGCDDTEILI